MKFILGQKLGMSQVFKDNEVIPVTLIEVGSCKVVQVKTKKKDGYEAVQVGFGKKRAPTKPLKDHLKKIKNNFRYLKEFRIENSKKFKIGDEVNVSLFKEGDMVKVSGLSKGKGFQGVVKRWGFKGSQATHGTKHTLRAPGSIGSAFPEKVFKGMKMAGRMGAARITVYWLEVIKVDPKNNLLVLKGAVPGRKGTLLEIKSK